MDAYANKLVKLTIGSCDDERLHITAHYNPKEVELAKQVSWSDEATLNQGMVAAQKRDPVYDLQYTGIPARTMALELFLDSFEPQPDRERKTVEQIVQKLHEMSSPRDEFSNKPHLRRPHICVIAWGGEFPRFTCVIESINVKYTMFDRDGSPVRATCGLKLKEARYTRELRARA